jgi:hypothetical protein
MGDSELVVDQVMKGKNYVDPKMAAYCQAVHDLKDMFHGLQLHHGLRDYNKAAHVLAKTTSSCSLVPHEVFASDQHASSVRAEGERPPEEEEPEVMAIDQPPELNLEDPDWRILILDEKCTVFAELEGENDCAAPLDVDGGAVAEADHPGDAGVEVDERR